MRLLVRRARGSREQLLMQGDQSPEVEGEITIIGLHERIAVLHEAAQYNEINADVTHRKFWINRMHRHQGFFQWRAKADVGFDPFASGIQFIAVGPVGETVEKIAWSEFPDFASRIVIATLPA